MAVLTPRLRVTNQAQPGIRTAMDAEPIFQRYEPKPELCGAALVDSDSLREIAEDLALSGYDVNVNWKRSITVRDGEDASVTAHVGQFLVRNATGWSAVDYHDFRKSWRKERSA